MSSVLTSSGDPLALGRRRPGGGRVENRDGECQRTNLDQITILEPAGLRGQRLAVNERAIATAEISHTHRIVDNRELRMLTTHLFAVGPQVTGLAAADLEVGPDQGYHLSLGLASHHHQLHFHENRPDLIGHQRRESALN